MSSHYDIIVIGGGASGMMAAGVAAARGKRVLVLEKNKHLGEKLKISGGGRCNVTNAEEDIRKFLNIYGDAEQFLYSPFSQFKSQDTFAFFQKRGLPFVVEENKRAFPRTHKALDVFRVLESFMKEGGVTVKTSSPVTSINKEGNRVVNVTVGTATYSADSYILATGGMSHPETGSTGDGFGWLRDLGHTVVAPTPSIVPLAAKERWIKDLAGVALPNAKITFFIDRKKAFSKMGNVLLTHFGLSGPTILNSAKQVADLLHEGEVTAAIDLRITEEVILKTFDEHKNKQFKNVFSLLVPAGTCDVLLSLLPNIDQEKQVNSITKEERRMIADLVKALPVTITGLMGFDRAVVADGGVPLTEIDTRTMRSRIVENLYVTGDLLHINRPSGGFSLQLCWTTGFVAGTHS